MLIEPSAMVLPSTVLTEPRTTPASDALDVQTYSHCGASFSPNDSTATTNPSSPYASAVPMLLFSEVAATSNPDVAKPK